MTQLFPGFECEARRKRGGKGLKRQRKEKQWKEEEEYAEWRRIQKKGKEDEKSPEKKRGG